MNDYNFLSNTIKYNTLSEFVLMIILTDGRIHLTRANCASRWSYARISHSRHVAPSHYFLIFSFLLRSLAQSPENFLRQMPSSTF